MLLNKIDLRPILRLHFETLKNNASNAKFSVGDLSLFFGLPSVVAIAVAATGFRFRVDAVNGFLNVFAFLTGLLLNLLVLVITISTSKPPQDGMVDLRGRLVKEVFANACYAVMIAVAVVCTALLALSYMKSTPGSTTGVGATFALIAFTLNFVLTLAMVLKRMFTLLEKEIEKMPGM